MEPKIGDFGLAREGPARECKSHITVSTLVGTAGYLPDEYLRLKRLSYEVDVHSYGMVLFELVTAKQPKWKHPQTRQELNTFIREAELLEMIDNSIEFDRTAVWMYGIAKDCTHKNKKKRASLKEVYLALHKWQNLYGGSPAMALQIIYDQKNAGKEGNPLPELTNELSNLNLEAEDVKMQKNPDLPAPCVLNPPQTGTADVNDQVVDSESDVLNIPPGPETGPRPGVVLPEALEGIPGLPACLDTNNEGQSNENEVELHFDDTTESIEESIDSTDTFTQEMSCNNPPPNLSNSN